MLNCYDVMVETAEGDFELLVWAGNHILMKKYVQDAFRDLKIQANITDWTRVEIYSGKILHLN